MELGTTLQLKKYAYHSIETDSVLMSMDTLEDFYLREKALFIGKTDTAQELIEAGNPAAATQLSTAPINTYAEDALIEVLEPINRGGKLHSFNLSTADENQLLRIANYCPVQFGEAVYAARSTLQLLPSYKSRHWDDDALCISAFNYKVLQEKSGNNKSTQSELMIYPNPSSDYMTCRLQASGNEYLERIEIYDVNGRLLMKKLLEKDTKLFTLQVSLFANGLYVLKAYSSEKVFKQKMMVNHD